MPGWFYTSPEVYAQEKDRIFLDNWLCVAHVDQVAKPGDFMTGEILEEPFIVSRDRSGEIHAFMNMCLHRGVPVAQGQGSARGFSCPYHAWGYDLEGRLVATPFMAKSEFNPDGARLRPLALAQWQGWIFISFNPQVVPFEEFFGPMQADLGWFRSHECRLAERVVMEVPCNWKLLLENLIDIYHVPILHKGSFGGFLKTDRNTVDFDLLAHGGWQYQQEAAPHAKGGRQLFPTLAWLEGQNVSTSRKAGIFPNLNLSLRFDSLRMWQVWPTSVDTSELHMFSLFEPAALDMPDFKAHYEEYKEFILSAIRDEDGPMVVKLQQAMASRFYQPGPFSHMEGAVHHMMNNYLDYMAPAIERISIKCSEAEQ